MDAILLLQQTTENMKAYQKSGHEFFYDKNQKQWVVYPIDSEGNRIEWDANDNPIEARYFINKTELNDYFKKL